MLRRISSSSRRVLPLLGLLGPILVPAALWAQRPAREPADLVFTPTPLQDDAQLHDVHLLAGGQAWAVGDHGTIWHSSDGGAHWKLQPSTVTAALHSVWFINRREGWIVGGETEPVTHRSQGVVLHTDDGGLTWDIVWPRSTGDSHRPGKSASLPPSPAAGASFQFQPPTGGSRADRAAASTPETGDHETRDPTDPSLVTRLPRLRRVRFFTPQIGLAAGADTDTEGGAVYQTSDGGQSWKKLGQTPDGEWLAADFANPDSGLVAGARGATARLFERRVDVSRRPNIGDRGLYDLALLTAQRGWVVGDGALILTTTNAGLVWEAPANSPPAEIRHLFDFRAVACRGSHVWVAGEPGTVIWHSPDQGETWESQSTGQNAPETALHFADEDTGIAVGAFGQILHTTDGGLTWSAARGAGRRIAFWQLHGHNADVRLALPVEFSGDMGYRSLVEVLARQDIGPGGVSPVFPLRLVEATTRAGGSAALTAWQFPLSIPGLERDEARLLREWNRRNENKLEELLNRHLVRQIRTWRPSVIVLDAPGDPLSQLLAGAVLVAVEQAGDSTQWLPLHEQGGLEAWRVNRVVQRVPAGESGAIALERHRLLPHLGLSNTLATRQAESLLWSEPPTTDDRPAWKVIWPSRSPVASSDRGGLMGGLGITAGSAARRPPRVLPEDDVLAANERARLQRNFAAISERALPDPGRSGQLLAELPNVLRDMPDAEGAASLARLAQDYASQGQWELAELTLLELVRRYPTQPEGLAAMQQLVQWWSSSELAWRRLRRSATKQVRLTSQVDSTRQALDQAFEMLNRQSAEKNFTAFGAVFEQDEPEVPQPTTGRVETAGGSGLAVVDAGIVRDFQGQLRYWNSQGARMARELTLRAPDLAGQPQVQLPLAALFRRQGFFTQADEIYSRQEGEGHPLLWRRATAAEQWIATTVAPPDFPAMVCYSTGEPPVLDGLLTDRCWQKAGQLSLSSLGTRATSDQENAPRAMTFLSRDDEYLYWAGSLPRLPGARGDRPGQKGRKHDLASSDLDHVTLLLDVDRDYHTSYRFTVDQTGETGDICLGDVRWNPRWFVAIAADETHWRFEAAIPWRELTPLAPGAFEHWLVGMVRIVPAVGAASWTQPALPVPRPESLGLLRFE
ncbi:MAG: YCF48-related protein [Planctomycetaceae bacterium]